MKHFYAMIALAACALTAQADRVSTWTGQPEAQKFESWTNGVIQQSADMELVGEIRSEKGYSMQTFGPKTQVVSRYDDEEEEEEEGCTVWFNLTKPDNDNQYEQPRVYLYAGGMFYQAFPRDLEWNYDAPFSTVWPIDEPGEYQVLIMAGFVGPNDYVGNTAIYKTLTIAEGDTELTMDVDLGEANICIYADGVMHDGKPFPVLTDDEPGNTPAVLGVYTVSVFRGGMSMMSMLRGISPLHYMVNSEFPDYASLIGVVRYWDPENNDGTMYAYNIKAPFTEDYVEYYPAESYVNYKSSFSYTENDLQNLSPGFDFGAINYSADGIQTGLSGTMYLQDVIKDMNIWMAIPESNPETCEYMFTSFSSVLGQGNMPWETRSVSPGRVMKLDGKNYIFNSVPFIDYDNRVISFVSDFNECLVDLEQQPIKNFYWPQYIYSYFRLRTSVEGDLQDAEMSLTNSGPFYESQYQMGVFDYITKVVCDGEEMTMNDIMGTQRLGSEVSFYASVPTLLTDDTESSADVVFSTVIEDKDDKTFPEFSVFQVRTSEGIITNRLTPGDAAVIYAGGHDRNSRNQMKHNVTGFMEIALQDSEEWIPVFAKEHVANGNIGKVYELELANTAVEEGKWYKVRTSLTDESNNTTACVVNYAFMVGEPSGIDALTDGNHVVSTTYFDLNGRRISAPAAGVYVKAETMSNGSVNYSKTVVR